MSPDFCRIVVFFISILFFITPVCWSEDPFAPTDLMNPSFPVISGETQPSTGLNPPSGTSALIFSDQPLSPLEDPAQNRDGKTAEFFSRQSLNYFDPQFGMIETESAYPFEGFRQKDFTQPTAIGFYALLLANVITGDIVTEHISKEQAKTSLSRMLDSLLRDQQGLGFKGLLPWVSFDGFIWKRKEDTFGEQVVLGDNANLTVSLGAAIGTLSDSSLRNDETVAKIKEKIETFLDRQEEGYRYLYDSSQGKFRRGWNYQNNEWVGGEGGRAHYFGDEFRQGILFLALRYGFADSVYTSLDIVTKEETLSNGNKLQVVLPFDGGAFQTLWPVLTMPESQDPHLYTMLKNFVTFALDYSRVHHLPGFLSASYGGIGVYEGNAGITAISYNGAPRNESVPSLYTLGAARMFQPEAVDAFLEEILSAHPDLESAHGFWEGVDISTGQVIQEQIAANVTSFVLGLAGTGPRNMLRYLEQKGLSSRLETVYHTEQPYDIVADSQNIYTWGSGSITANTSGSEYRLSASRFFSSGTAFIQNSINVSGKKLRIRYTNNQAVTAKIEFKEHARDGLELRHRIDRLFFANTNGGEQEILLDLPPSLALLSIDEVVLFITLGVGGSIDFAIRKFEIVPQNFHDLIRQGSDIFTWGDNQLSGYRSGKDEYVIQSPQFYSSGTAFIQNKVNASGAELKIRYRSTTKVGKVKFELKERGPNGLQTQLELRGIAFENTGGMEKEISFALPVSSALSRIDEIVMLISEGEGTRLDLTIMDLDVRLHHSINLISDSISNFSWGDGVNGEIAAPDEYRLQSSHFSSSGTAFVQDTAGINIAAKKLEIRYRSTTDVGKMKLEFKERTSEGLQGRYATPEVTLINTRGGEAILTVDLPPVFELFNIHEAVVLISNGSGGPLDILITQLVVLPQASKDIVSESTGSFSWGERITGTDSGDSYFLSSSSFSSSGTVFIYNNLDILSPRFLRVRYKSMVDAGTAKLEFKVRDASGVQTIYETAPFVLSNTEGSEKEILLAFPSGLDLLGIDEIVLSIFGGSGRALELTLLDLDIF